MKILSTILLLFLLTNCAGGNVAKIKFGKKCTVADSKNLDNLLIFGLLVKKLSMILTKNK